MRKDECAMVVGTGPAKMWQTPLDGRYENSTQCGATAAVHASAQLLGEPTVVLLMRWSRLAMS